MTFWRFFCVLYVQRAACSTFQTCILNLHLGHTMCGSMVDMQSPTAEIRRGKKKEEEETTGWKYIWPALLHRAAVIRCRYEHTCNRSYHLPENLKKVRLRSRGTEMLLRNLQKFRGMSWKYLAVAVFHREEWILNLFSGLWLRRSAQ